MISGDIGTGGGGGEVGTGVGATTVGVVIGVDVIAVPSRLKKYTLSDPAAIYRPSELTATLFTLFPVL